MDFAHHTLPAPLRLALVLSAALASRAVEARMGDAGKASDRKDGSGVQSLEIDRPLIAYWRLDEEFGGNCRDSSGNGCDAAPEEGRSEGLYRIRGVFGNALCFSGGHKLRAPQKPAFGEIPEISLSAWTKPRDLRGYREIFRKEDGSSRVLFSFQHDGAILALGLNIGGYVECDAEIRPEQILDGRWHHCAATFDGDFLRVYLDGREVGSLKRPGTISAGGKAPGCIGSSNGSENFQGVMDDLRIYAEALTPDEISRIYQNGVEALATRQPASIDAGEPRIDRPLLGYWKFNESPGAATIEDSEGETIWTVEDESHCGVPVTRGVYGNALELAGRHSVRAKDGMPPEGTPTITLSVWTVPADLRGNREILRQECAERVLFSFQDDGTILSLGLNVNGYVECDAAIEPAQVLDGQWHHCAGAFDGDFLRVYLDGKEVGSLRRAGEIATEPAIPAFIGSSSGAGEFFQGSLDDLRIYRDALTPEEIAFLYADGVKSIESRSKALEAELASLYSPRGSFAETLAGARKNIVDRSFKLRRDLARAILARLKSGFPDDYENFIKWTGVSPLEYLASGDHDLIVRKARRLVELLLEYCPLTEDQRKYQSPEELRKWEVARGIQKKLEKLEDLGDSARFSPAWIEIVLEAGSRIQFRPSVSEAVAPYVTPHTPRTRNLSAAEAREALERDWLHQTGGKPTPERIRSEIAWARRLARRIQSAFPGEVDLSSELSELDRIEKPAASPATPFRETYLKVRDIKRSILFKNPVVDFEKVLLVDMPFPQGSEWPHQTRHRLGYMAVPGARLLILEGLSPEGRLTQLMPRAPLHGSFWRPDVSYDATRVLFCFKPHNEKSFHLYEINVDGTGLAQLTDGGFDDLDPIYLPDDRHILFSTTRGHTYVRCMPPTNAFVLARCDREGKDIYLISHNNEPDYLPSVMNDGRVVYTRWEYTDKPLWRAQALWTVNPDGTQVNAFWGNQSVWPDLLKDARNIPGSRRVMFTGSAHHNWFSGSIGIIDPVKGSNFPDGLTKVTPDVSWPESGNGPVDPAESPDYHESGHYSAYYSPYPLSEQDFLVSANRRGKFVLYLMDVDGNRELIYEGVNNIFHAMPLKPRERPPVISDRVAWPAKKDRLDPKRGVIFSSNVFQGAPEELRGKARFLRVITIDPKTYTYWHKRPYISTGPVVSAVQSDGVKRILGTVPIEKDGSVAFYAPASTALHFQLLDGRYRALQTMRSFTGVMPGEYRGCLGCHELHSKAPEVGRGAIALSKGPRDITPPPWGRDTVSYPRYVQPVLDEYCGSCHQGDGEARETLDLTARAGFLMFGEPYMTLAGRPTWGRPYRRPENPPPGFGIANTILVEAYDQRDPKAYQTPEPMTRLSYKSRLIDLASSGEHYDVEVDPVSLRKLIAWVDTMCPYRGDKEVREIPDPIFQGVDWLDMRPRIKTAPVIVRPGPVD